MLKFLILILAVAYAHEEADVGEPNFLDGRTVIVHLFEWRWTDIADECENFLGPYGYAGVQVSPPMRHREYADYGYPWWQRYQPVDYTLESRSGTELEFQEMVSRCNAAGVRVYVDAVINHMAAAIPGQEADMYNFDGVPYDQSAFNVPNGRCTTASGNIESYQDADQVRYCNLLGLPDLDYRTEIVEESVEGYLNKLLSYGVAGFRIDAAKHMDVEEIEHLAGHHLNDCSFGGRPYFYQEVIDMGGEPIMSSDYIHSGDVTEFKYCEIIAQLGRGEQSLAEFENFPDATLGLLPSDHAFVFVDNHDNQRGHGAGGEILNFQSPDAYTKATALTLAWNYGTKRVMSSYAFADTDQGPPSDGNGNTISPTFDSTTLECTGDWICEHRWRAIRNMACFSNVAGTAAVENWADNGNNFISFSRGGKAFFAMSNESGDVSDTRQTGLPAGTYCDLISGESTALGCSGDVITVAADGTAQISLSPGAGSMVAITAVSTPGSSSTGCQM
ncbi:alpha-amylase A-like [Diadema antillarum]|uniref:alpha-amylase A-like n=1 Tax=Diadema antillarum TaxID=105358 RepID=UPI003A8ADF35